MADVVCVGDTAMDEYYQVPRLPGPDEKVLTTFTGRFPGGTACNTARALRRMGASVLFLTRIGEDESGKVIEEQFEKIGLAARFLRSPRTPTAQILVAANGEKAILLHGFDQPPTWSADEMNRFLEPAPARVVFTTLSLALREELLMFQSNLVISLEPSIVEWDRGNFTWSAQHAHTLILDRHTFHFLFQEDPSARNIAAVFDSMPAKPHSLIVTMGAQGCLGIGRMDGRVHAVPSFEVNVVDTTGAGDTFNAAFIHAFFNKTLPFERSLQFANAMAAASCENRGTELTAQVLARGEKLYQSVTG